MSLYGLEKDKQERYKKTPSKLTELEESRKLNEGLMQKNFELKETLAIREQLRQHQSDENKKLRNTLSLLLEFASPDTPAEVRKRVHDLLK